MTSIRQFTMNDLFYFNNVNLDVLTETYNLSFYMSYMTYWPESFMIATTTHNANNVNNNKKKKKNNNNNDKGCESNGPNSFSDGRTAFSNHVSATSTDSTNNNNNNNNNQSNVNIIMGYLLGKAEGEGNLWHGHVSAITISKYYRRISMAKYLMHQFETTISTDLKQNYFVDLFVRTSNTLAIQMYHNLGYRIYRTVLGYYQTSSGNTTTTNKNTTTSHSKNNSKKDNSRHSGISENNQPEDAYDMRKSLLRDPQQLSMIPLPHPIYPEDLEW